MWNSVFGTIPIPRYGIRLSAAPKIKASKEASLDISIQADTIFVRKEHYSSETETLKQTVQ